MSQTSATDENGTIHGGPDAYAQAIYALDRVESALSAAGFDGCQMLARYEIYPSLTLIGEYLALQLDSAGDADSAATFRDWSQQPGGLFAQCWVSCIARKRKAHPGRDD